MDHEIKIMSKNTKPIVKYNLNKYKKYEFNKWEITSFKNKDLVYAL